MFARLLVYSLLAATFFSVGTCRPQYQPYSAAFEIKNDTFYAAIVYSNWQGYFLNTYTLSNGKKLDTSQDNPVLDVAFFTALRVTARLAASRSCLTSRFHNRRSDSQSDLVSRQ